MARTHAGSVTSARRPTRKLDELEPYSERPVRPLVLERTHSVVTCRRRDIGAPMTSGCRALGLVPSTLLRHDTCSYGGIHRSWYAGLKSLHRNECHERAAHFAQPVADTRLGCAERRLKPGCHFLVRQLAQERERHGLALRFW